MSTPRPGSHGAKATNKPTDVEIGSVLARPLRKSKRSLLGKERAVKIQKLERNRRNEIARNEVEFEEFLMHDGTVGTLVRTFCYFFGIWCVIGC